MKRSLIAIFIAFTTTFIFPALVPGCTRKNSEGIIRDLLFMQIENGHMGFAISLLDTETMNLKNLSGASVTAKLTEVQNRYDINPVLTHLQKLSDQATKLAKEPTKLTQIDLSPIVPDLPD